MSRAASGQGLTVYNIRIHCIKYANVAINYNYRLLQKAIKRLNTYRDSIIRWKDTLRGVRPPV